MTAPGGVLTEPSNIGRYHHDDCSVVPELIIDFGWRITPSIRFSLGYDLLYVSNVMRVSSVIDSVDGRQVIGSTLYNAAAAPTATSPAYPAGQSGGVFWRRDSWRGWSSRSDHCRQEDSGYLWRTRI